MANALTAFNPKYWSKRMQMIHEKEVVYRAICNFEEREVLSDGDTVARPYRSAMVAQTYVKGTAVTIQDVSATEETLVVNVAKIVPFYVDDLDRIQNKWNTVDAFAEDASNDLYQIVDGDVLGEYDQATSVLDNYDFGGTLGDGLTITTSNILQVFARASKKLDALNIKAKDRFAVISPQLKQVLVEYLGGKESLLGDSTGENGNIGRYGGFELYVSNALGWSASLAFGTNPTADDTVVINGVTFTFKATPAAAGQVDIGADAAASLVLLVAAVNNTNGYAAGAGAAAAYFEVTAADRAKLAGVTATNATSAMTLKGEGVSYLVVSETLTAAADIWTLAKQIQHNLFGQKKAIDLVIQKAPSVEFRMVENKLGRNVLPWVLYGLKTFNEGKPRLVDVKMRSDSF
jgi:hypothetical protein